MIRLILLLALMIGLTFSQGAPTSSASAMFEGIWVAPAETPSLTQVVISRNGSELVVDAWGSCQPVDCRWPRRPLTLFVDTKDFKTYDRGMATFWEQTKSPRYAIFTRDEDALIVEIYTIFGDGSGRPNYHSTSHLIRRPAIPPLRSAIRPSPTASAAGLALLSPLENAIKDAYQSKFHELIARPAIYNDPTNGNCRGEAHVTTTAYLRLSATTSTLMVMYTSGDGTVMKEGRTTVLAPSGTIRVLVVLIRQPVTVREDALALWQDAQKQINEDHAAFAKRRGYSAPIVVFENTNVILDPDKIRDPRDPDSVRAAVAKQGVPSDGYQLIMTINIDPKTGEGGTSLRSRRSIYVGNVANWNAPLGAAEWKIVAATAYHHEVAHHWGWEHDWTPSCGRKPSDWGPFITAPVLFGWEDMDGDGVPEILDDTPYARPR